MPVNLPSQNKQSRAVLILLILLALEAWGALLALLISPSDPENRLFLGFSGLRLTVILGMLAVSILASFLAYKAYKDRAWLVKLSIGFLGERQVIPSIYLTIFIFTLFLSGTLIIFFPQRFLLLTRWQITRLIPVMTWLVLLFIQGGLAWAWFWLPHKIALPPNTPEWGMAVLLFVIAIIPRLSLASYSLPYQSVWDEVVTYPQAMNMLTTPGLKPVTNVPGYGASSYGDLLVYITTAGEVFGLMDGFRTQRVNSIQAYVNPPDGAANIFGAVNITGFPLKYPRMLLALINSLSPVLIFLALRKFLKANVLFAFGGALLYAFLSREVIYYSSFILPDALAVTIFLGELLAAFTCLDDTTGRMYPYFITGFLGGMVLSTVIRLWTVASLPFLALLLARDRQRFLFRILAILTGLAAGFFITSPYALIDLPNMLNRWTSLTWFNDLTLSHRFSSLVFYLQGMFKPGFNSSYIDTTEGSIGFGLFAGMVALLGIGKMLARYPRQAILIMVFAVLQMYSIMPITQRYTRHALTLYPLACILAGMGLWLLADGLRFVINWISARAGHVVPRKINASQPALLGVAPLIVLALFLLVNLNQFSYTFSYVRRVVHYKPVQVRASEYLNRVMQPGDKVGILDLIPWVTADLKLHHIHYEQVALKDTPQTLKARGITYVVGTDRMRADYGSAAGTMWSQDFNAPGSRLAEFGTYPLEFAGYPVNELYIFIARIPG